jgi:transcriptional regulator NrdR family protein
METGGGTNLWCPKCACIKECKVLWYENKSNGNFFDTDFPDLHWRERSRECNSCGHQFNTYEIEGTTVSELIELRKLLKEFQKLIEEQQKYPTSLQKTIHSSLSDD